MSTQLNFYRIKTEFYQEDENGGMVKQKTEDLVQGVGYSDAEQTAYQLAKFYARDRFAETFPINIEITKTKINELLFNNILSPSHTLVNELVCCGFEKPEESGVGMYSVKIMFFSEDENGKEKKTTEIIYVPAESNTDAAMFVQTHLRKLLETRSYVIREVKFDKAENILWTIDEFNLQVSVFNK